MPVVTTRSPSTPCDAYQPRSQSVIVVIELASRYRAKSAAESPPWNLTDAWGTRDVGAVLREAEKMLDRTGDPVSRTIPRLVGQLTKHVQRARAAHRLEEQGLTPQEAASQLGMKPYPAQKLFAQVRNFSGAELDDALIRLAELDHALKGGSRLANELELERALVDITQPRSIVKDAA